MTIEQSDLLNLIYFFISISIALPTFMIPFGNSLLEEIRKDFQEIRFKALQIVNKENDAELEIILNISQESIAEYLICSRPLLFLLLIFSTINVFVGVLAMVSDGLFFIGKLSKANAIIGLFCLQILLFYINVVIANIFRPNTEIDNLRQYLIDNHSKHYLK